jgi:hypothetical protein
MKYVSFTLSVLGYGTVAFIAQDAGYDFLSTLVVTCFVSATLAAAHTLRES